MTGRAFISIDRPLVNIGRSIKNDMVIKKNTVSARHASIEQKTDGYFVIDRNSTNKTLLNGQILDPNKPVRLNDGDEISIDTFSFVFREERTPPPVPDDDDETIFFDEAAMGDAGAAGTPPPLPPDSDETVLFDSGSMTDAAKKPDPAPPAADGDETVFFDSGALNDAGDDSAPVPPPADNEETIFFDGDADEAGEEETVVRDRPPAPGGTVKKIGNYEVRHLLGKGGFGSVWKARTAEGHPVAIKVLNPDVLENERAVRKFFHEAIILSRLDHPNICRFIDFFPHEENYAIVMDFVQGTELKTLLEERKGPLPLEMAKKIAAQSLDAFHYAHQKQVLHRDIKPENISLDVEGTAKVMDFGIAKLSSTESQQTSLFMISPAYTAPERFDANKTDMVDHRSDIYSLGLVFYEIFTGTHPFPTTNPTEMIIAHMNQAPTPPDAVADVPPDVSTAILTALEKDPLDRFENFGAFKMAMLGEMPREGLSQTAGSLSFSGDYCRAGAAVLKMLAGIVKKYQKTASSITLIQQGTEVHLTIETLGGNSIRITKSMENFVKH